MHALRAVTRDKKVLSFKLLSFKKKTLPILFILSVFSLKDGLSACDAQAGDDVPRSPKVKVFYLSLQASGFYLFFIRANPCPIKKRNV